MRRRTLAGVVAATAAVTLIATASVVWPGLDAKETPEVDTAVWALQTGEGRQYARVNTTVRELDTVRSVDNPDLVVETSDATYLYSDSLSTVTRIDEAHPVDLDDEALRASVSTPSGTVDVANGDDFVAYLTSSGSVFAGRLSAGSATQLNPLAEGEDGPQFRADAIAVDERGMLFAYSATDDLVLRYDIPGATVRGLDPVPVDVISNPGITAAGDIWTVVDTESGALWTRDAEAGAQFDVIGTVVVGEPDPDGDTMYVADERSIVRIPADGSPIGVAYDFGDDTLGLPAPPVVHDGDIYAAWLRPGAGGGVLWSRDGGATPLDYGEEELSEQRRPAFVEGSGALVLNEARSGWVWTVPEGVLVASSQDWTLDDRVETESVRSEEQLPVLLDPRPPIAEPDSFGVRAASLAVLPVLMNDHDPNEDVLSIDAASVSGLDPGFGTVSITDDGQRFALRVEPGASGSSSFSYAVTDGTAEGGLLSPPTTVTVTVEPDSVNTSPVWCGVERCLLERPEPEVAAGGTISIPVLPGWVDPEGDPLLLLSVENRTGIGSVAATPTGDVVYQHDDDGSGAEQLIELAATVSDTRGATTTESIIVRVSPRPEVTVQSFAVVDVLGAGITVDVAPHVTGTSGRLSIESVRVLDDAPASATIVGGTTEFDFASRTAGTFRVDITVTDGTDEASGTARITILPPDAPPQLATAPVVAFVHPQEDATIDVFAAVSNPTRRVLLLSDVRPSAEAGATFSVDAVGQNHLRVSGTTSTGAPGRLGTVRYTVSDGSEDAGASVEGEATVYLLPPAPELAPIAVDDTVVVRAGAQVDIPVLENDISPAGGRPTLDPSSVTSSTEDALAFASGDLLRYLAPSEPGDHTVQYSVFTPGTPSLQDVATVRVEVLADEENRAPLPETLEGRVLSGQATAIEFDPYGMDPDGDTVTLDRIVTQPERGSATIAADGSSIVYSSVPGDRGQVSFTYRVADQSGETGEATVRIGVLDAESNPSPVTYTDYVQVQAGEGNTIRVDPLANDVDPIGGSLSLVDVRPDLPELLDDGGANPAYERLEDRLVAVDESAVVVTAGPEVGTMSFLYDIESSSGNTARGLIVVKVVRESVPDYPVVRDTILTAETREEFPTGVDVLTGKATWSGGDVDSLDVELWGSPREVAVSGRDLRGPLAARTRVIPFEVTGTGVDGDVTTYAFLRVPGADDVTLALRSSAVTPEVAELESVSFDMARLVAMPRGGRLQLGGDVGASGARPESSCAIESGTVVSYTAAVGAPWVDACSVPVRLEGQPDWTYLSVPIRVIPRDPQPELRAGSLTVGPGETATFDLRSITTWQLREDWAGIVYSVEYGGPFFDVSLDGSIVTVTGADDARAGTDDAAIVSVSSHSSVAPVRLILRVGAAPSALPRGGSLTQQCSQAGGTTCTIPVIGAPGEVNPLPGTPLEVVSVRDAGACVGVSFSLASPTAVTASWVPDAAGQSCTASFALQDAQGRRTNGDRDGSVTLDLLGYPQAPASITQTGYSDRSLTLQVDPGAARLAYPAVTGFAVMHDGGEVARCTADGVCPAVGAPNGEQREYVAFAVNEVGRSSSSVRTLGWAYDVPAAPSSVTARPVPTAGAGGVVALTIDGLDPDETGSVEISSPAGEVIRIAVDDGATTLEVPSYRIGTNTSSPVSVTPYSRFELPPGLNGVPNGATTIGWGNGVGAPLNPQIVLTSASDGERTSTITASATAQRNGDGSTLRYGIVRDGQSCTVSTAGPSATFPGLPDGEEYGFVLCVESAVGEQSFGRAMSAGSVRAQQSGRAPRGYTFVVNGNPDVTSTSARWVVRETPTSSEPLPNRNRVEFEGLGSGIFGQDPGIRARYVHEDWGTPTAWSPATPRAGSAPYQVQANWSVSSCAGGSPLGLSGTSSNDPAGAGASIEFGNDELRYFDAAGDDLPYDPGSWSVPFGAVRVEGISVTVRWPQPWGLNPASATFTASCTPNDPPPPPPGGEE